MKNVISKNLIIVSLNTSLYDIALIMKNYDVGFILVSNESKIVGVLTDRDIVVKILANKDFKIDGYLSVPIYIDINCSINEALDKMSHEKIKRLIVCDNKKVVGVLSISDLLMHNYDVLNTIKSIYQINKNTDSYDTKVNDFYL